MSLIRDQAQREFKPRRVGIVEFSESEEFCGKPLYPYQRILLKLIFLEEMEGWEEDLLTKWINGGRSGEVIISPEIRERRDWCRTQGYEHFSQVDLVGGRRSSKGYVTGLAATYKLWKVRNIPDPGMYYNMDVDKQIEFSCIAASLNQAKTRQFADFYSSITRCTALVPYLSKQQEEMISVKCDSDETNIQRMKSLGLKVARDFAKLRVLPIAANADTLRGSASILTVFDEMAFMLPGESRSSASECYTAMEPSLAQFGYHALVFANSSPYTKIGKFFELFEQAMRKLDHKDGGFPMRFTLQYPSWAMYDEWWKDPGFGSRPKYQQAVMVSPNWPIQLDEAEPASKLNKLNLSQRTEEQLKQKANPDTYRVEYGGQWAEVLDAYLDPLKVDLAFIGMLPDGRPHTRTFGGSYMFGEYKIHCDPSSTTAGFGFAVAHVEEFEDPTEYFPDGKQRHVVFDLVMRWNPEDFGGTINYLKVQSDIGNYIDLYRPGTVTFDQYNSPGLIQGLQEYCRTKNITETRISKIDATRDLNWNRWEAFKTALNLGLVHIPPDCIGIAPSLEYDHSEWAKQELKFLQEIATSTTKRVDKQEIGPVTTKDIADCICIVTYAFLGSYLADTGLLNFKNSRVVTGAEGGYPIGGREPGGPMASFQHGAGRFNDFYGTRQQGPFVPARGINPNRSR